MKAGAHPALAQGKVRYVGDHVAVVIADTLRRGQGRLREDQRSTTACCPGHRPRRRRAQEAGRGEPVHDVAPDNTVFEWHIGDKDATEAAFANAAHVTKLDLVNNRLDRRTRWSRAQRSATTTKAPAASRSTRRARTRMSRAWCCRPSSASRPRTSCASSRPTSAVGSAPKIFIYAEETVCVWAAKKVGRPVKWTCDRTEAFLCDAHGRDHVSHAELATRRRRQDDRPACPHDAEPRRLSVDLRVLRCRPTSTRRCCRASTTFPTIYCRSRRGLHQHVARSTPTAAPVVPRPPIVVERLIEVAARETGKDPAEFRRKNFITSRSRTRRRSSCATMPATTRRRSTRRWRRPTTKASGARKAESAKKAAAARHRLLRLTSRPAASRRRPRSARSAPVSACGNRPRCASTRSARSRCLTGSHSPRPGPRDDLRPARLRPARHPDRQRRRSSTATPIRCRWAWAPTARVPARSACRRSSKALDKIEAKAKKVAGHVLEASPERHRVQGRQVHRQGHRQGDRLRLRRAAGLCRAQVQRARSLSRA